MPELPERVAASPHELGASSADTVGSDGKARGLVAKALSFLQSLLRSERRPWAIAVGAGFGLTLTVGHVVGGVSGLLHGYERLAGIWFGPEAAGQHSSSSKPEQQLNSHARALAHELRAEFTRARDKLEQTGFGDFSRAEEALVSLRKLDEQIGHVWYFEGEITRLKNAAMFSHKSCLKTLPGGDQPLDVYHQAFYRYLEIASSLPEPEAGGDKGSELCYQRANGYCTQRTAWIHHLLANDFYQSAMALDGDDLELTDKLERAGKHAQEARRYRSPEGIEGFVQCIGTLVLEQKIAARLEAIRKRN